MQKQSGVTQMSGMHGAGAAAAWRHLRSDR